MKNECAKTRPITDPYEVWSTNKAHLIREQLGQDKNPLLLIQRRQSGEWQWHVLKKWQADDSKPYARWFCKVYTDMTPEGEMGDVYVSEIKDNAVRVL